MASEGGAGSPRYAAEPPAQIQPRADIIDLADSSATTGAEPDLAVLALEAVESAPGYIGQMAREAAESLERRGADLELRNRLAQDNFEGSLWERFADELAAYGVAVLRAWFASGYIFTMCARRRVPLNPKDSDFRIDRDTQAELVLETVAKAIIAFRQHALVGQRWQYHGGATLKTYFIGACVYAFAGVFRRWQTTERQWLRGQLRDVSTTSEADVLSDDPAIEVAIRDVVLSELRAIPRERSRAVATLTVDDYTQEEIADALGMTGPRAVEGVMRRVRAARAKRDRGES